MNNQANKIFDVIARPFTPNYALPAPPLHELETEVQKAMQAQGFTFLPDIIFDGEIHRFATNGKPNDNAVGMSSFMRGSLQGPSVTGERAEKNIPGIKVWVGISHE